MINDLRTTKAQRDTLVPEPNLLEVVAWLLANTQQGVNICQRETNPAPEALRATLPVWQYELAMEQAVVDALRSGFVQQLTGEARIWFKYLNRYAALYAEFGNPGFDDPDALALYRQARERRDDLIQQLRAQQQARLNRKRPGQGQP
jgi:hypothetical protein